MSRVPDPEDAELVRTVREHTVRSSEPGRHRARRSAMMLLYRTDLMGSSRIEALEGFEAEHGFEMPAYGRRVIEGIEARAGEIDEQVSARLTDWTIDRLGVVERTVLRIGMFELLEGEVPVPVAIDEAVELTKRYATPEAAQLVNGVLGAWAREEQGE